MKSSFDKRKRAKYLSAFYIIVCFVITECSGQNYVNDFTTVTWNTNGGRWRNDDNKINIPMIMNSGVQVLAVQEAGKLPDGLQTINPGNIVDLVRVDGSTINNDNRGINVSNFHTGKNDVFIYLFDRKTYNEALTLPPLLNNPNKRQNLALVSQYKANKVILIEHRCRSNSNRENINRPAMGILIKNTVFFSLHPEPCDKQNEAPSLINAIQSYMSTYHPTKTWIAMGDFNREPDNLENNINSPPANMYHKVIATGSNTRTRELDYSVVGGPINYFFKNGVTYVPKANLLWELLKRSNLRLINPSDHQPVIFKR